LAIITQFTNSYHDAGLSVRRQVTLYTHHNISITVYLNFCVFYNVCVLAFTSLFVVYIA